MTRLFRGRTSVLLATLMIGIGATLAFWSRSWLRPSRWLASQIGAEWESGSEGSLELRAQQLTALEDSGWRELIEGLHSQRSDLRPVARRTIENLIRSWEGQPSSESAPKASRLAQLLAESLDNADNSSIGDVAELAGRLLDWPPGQSGSLNRVYYCEQVLRTAKQRGWPKPLNQPAAPVPPSLSAILTTPDDSPPAAKVPAVIDEDDSLRELPDRVRFRVAPPADPQPAPPGVVAQLPGLRSDIPRELAADPATPIEPATTQPLATSRSLRPAIIDWRSLELPELIRHLRARGWMSEAESELLRRGFDQRNLNVARGAADPDPENRLQLIRSLLGVPGIDTTGWLLVLARDDSTRVRSAAIQMLSTSADPRILRQLETLEETETDVGIRAALQRAREFVR